MWYVYLTYYFQAQIEKNRIGPKVITHGLTISEGQQNWLKFGIQIVHAVTY